MTRSKSSFSAGIAVSILFAAAALGQSDPGPTLKKLDFLLGNWVGVAGEKETPLGAGQGGFSFEAQLGGKIIVRKNQANYANAVRHEDLMVIYLDGPDNAPRAIYFDSEGHTIRYNVAFPSANAVTFDSDGTQPGARYRLSYWMDGAAMKGKFEVGAPGAEYKPYMSWTSKRN